MPYGDLAKQAVQRFATLEDLDRHRCTIEEREEYEPHITAGAVVYAGVDYAAITRQAQEEADIIIWEGGNNDFPFLKTDLMITIVDPLRPGHEMEYHPGETCLRMADVVLVNKVDTADFAGIQEVRASARAANPRAVIVDAASPVFVDHPEQLVGARALVIEDGPTVTHGSMAYGAGAVVAQKHGAVLVDPRPYAVGSIARTFAKYPHLERVLPAMGYSDEQMQELKQTIEATSCDVVISATPIDVGGLLRLARPVMRVRYELQEIGSPTLEDVLVRFKPTA
jgi:predicted GTPase